MGSLDVFEPFSPNESKVFDFPFWWTLCLTLSGKSYLISVLCYKTLFSKLTSSQLKYVCCFKSLSLSFVLFCSFSPSSLFLFYLLRFSVRLHAQLSQAAFTGQVRSLNLTGCGWPCNSVTPRVLRLPQFKSSLLLLSHLSFYYKKTPKKLKKTFNLTAILVPKSIYWRKYAQLHSRGRLAIFQPVTTGCSSSWPC